MKLIETEIPGLYVAEGHRVSDHRGEFQRLFCADALKDAVAGRNIVQINRSLTREVGAIRGLHYQNAPMAEMKIVRCLRGRVFDVAVDLRKGSPAFLKWVAVELSPDSNRCFIIPEGCAHGFQVLERDSELLYLHTAFYSPSREAAIRYDDPLVGVMWPLAAADLSKRDSSHAHLQANFEGITL